jgi:hypothetical protein
MIQQYEGKRPASLDVFLEYVGLTEQEFLEIALTHQVSPYQHDPLHVEAGEPLPDQAVWDRTR